MIQFGKSLLLLIFLASPVSALMDYVTDNPQIIITIEKSKVDPSDEKTAERIEKARGLIQTYFQDWQARFGKVRRHLRINLVPVTREINLAGSMAEGVWSWTSFKNEEGTLILCVSGDLYVNINSTLISQEALIAHESSHAFLLAYHPKLLENKSDTLLFNEGLAELFAVQYEPTPWRNWDNLLLAHRHQTPFQPDKLSAYGRRILNILTGKPQTHHDIGFFYLFVVRNGKVDLEHDLKDCTNNHITGEIQKWAKENPNTMDLPMIRE